MVVTIPPAYQPTIVSTSPSYPPGGEVRLALPPQFCSDLDIDGPNEVGWRPVLVDAAGNWAVSSEGTVGSEIGHGDKTGVTVTIRPNTRPGTYSLYLMYQSRSDRPLSITQCTGFASCSGTFRGLQLLAPVTIEVAKG